MPLLRLIVIFLLLTACQQSQNPSLHTDNIPRLSVLFSPRGGCTSAVVAEIRRAKESIDVAMFSFTSRRILKELIRAYERGVRVRVLIDEGTAKSRNSVVPILETAGIPVRLKRGSSGGLMHHKYAVIDHSVVITGSFNWTVSAEKRNDENLLIFRSAPKLAGAYERNFEKLWRLAGLTN